MSNPWFRFYSAVLNDPKVQHLEPRLFKTWVNVLCVAGEHDGIIPVADLPFHLRMSEKIIEHDMDALTQAGLIDEFEGVVTPHNWNGRQFQSDNSTERVKRFRNAERNGTETASETPPDTEQNRTEQTKETRASRAVVEKEFNETFYPAYPHKVQRAAALKAWHGARRRASLAEIMEGLARYKRDRRPDINWRNPATFLNGEGWLDTPASGTSNGATTLGPPTVWVTNEDPRWKPLARRWDETWGGSPPARGSRHEAGIGFHFPADWLSTLIPVPSEVPFSDGRER